jgi:hypothetical protein
MRHWIWIDPEVLLAVHEEQLAEHGGAAGIRDQKLFESALARPQQVDAYGLPAGSRPRPIYLPFIFTALPAITPLLTEISAPPWSQLSFF